jgi:hypothetical protein
MNGYNGRDIIKNKKILGLLKFNLLIYRDLFNI